jgi:hypothetical protein
MGNENLLEIKIARFESGKPLSRDIFVFLPKNQKMIRLFKKGDTIDQGLLERFKQKGLGTLFVSTFAGDSKDPEALSLYANEVAPVVQETAPAPLAETPPIPEPTPEPVLEAKAEPVPAPEPTPSSSPSVVEAEPVEQVFAAEEPQEEVIQTFASAEEEDDTTEQRFAPTKEEKDTTAQRFTPTKEKKDTTERRFNPAKEPKDATEKKFGPSKSEPDQSEQRFQPTQEEKDSSFRTFSKTPEEKDRSEFKFKSNPKEKADETERRFSGFGKEEKDETETVFKKQGEESDEEEQIFEAEPELPPEEPKPKASVEDMRRDLPSVVSRLASYLGHSLGYADQDFLADLATSAVIHFAKESGKVVPEERLTALQKELFSDKPEGRNQTLDDAREVMKFLDTYVKDPYFDLTLKDISKKTFDSATKTLRMNSFEMNPWSLERWTQLASKGPTIDAHSICSKAANRAVKESRNMIEDGPVSA